jgi:ABC-type multidrug transport system ATPase subunit
VLASRTSIGTVSGDMHVNCHQRDQSFQQKTGYVQQLDLHLETSTLREALLFSAFLRQPYHVSREEKVRYVDEVIKMLEIEQYSQSLTLWSKFKGKVRHCALFSDLSPHSVSECLLLSVLEMINVHITKV